MAINLYSKAIVSRRRGTEIRVRSLLSDSTSNLKLSPHQEPTTRETATSFKPIKAAVQATLEYIGHAGAGLEIGIASQIPVGVGLGSSAAVAVSTISATAKLFDVKVSKEDVFRLAFATENLIHGNPSGIDQMTSIEGGIVLYRVEEGFRKIKAKKDIPLVIGNTGVTRSTGDLVRKVRELAEERKGFFKPIAESCGEISLKAAKAIQNGNLNDLGMLMNMNHNLLVKISVSHEKLSHLVEAAREAGALGAKLTGAGGGGCMIALPTSENAEDIVNAINIAGGKAYSVTLDKKGVVAWLEN